MRIGIVTGEYPPMQGGVGAYTQILARELVRQGEQVFLFSSVRAQSDDLPLVNRVQRWGISSLRSLADWAQTERLDIVNMQFQTAAYRMSPWIHFLPDFLRSVPVVTTFHDLRYPYLFPKAGRLRGWIVMRLARRSAGVIVTNHEDLARVQNLPFHALIPIGSNILETLSNFNAQRWREKINVEPDDFLLAYFGFLNRSKGAKVLLDSLAALRRENIPAHLVMIGDSAGSSDPTNRVYAAEIETQVSSLNLTPYVHRTGFVDEQAVGAYLKASDVVVLPFLDGASYRRGSLMAAVRYGCAIVTTTPTINIPTFKHENNLLLVPPNDTRALTSALRRLYQEPELRSRLQAGTAQLSACFDWSQIASDTIQFFSRVTGVPV